MAKKKESKKTNKKNQDSLKQRLIKVDYFPQEYNKGKCTFKDKVVLTIKDETGKKSFNVINNPKNTFYVDKPGVNRLRADFFVPREEVEEYIVENRQLIFKAAEVLGVDKWFREQIKQGRFKEAKDRIMLDPRLHQADKNIEDFYMSEYEKIFEDKIDNNIPLSRGFWDIEIDRYNITNATDILTPDFPIDLISFKDDTSSTIHLVALRNKENPQIARFERRLSTHIERNIKRHDLKDLKVAFFDDELRMIKHHFNTVQKYSPDLLGAWNQEFDILYTRNRIERLTRKPADLIMCDQNLPYKRLYYYMDTFSKKIWESGSYAIISGMTHYVCQCITYASLRATARKLDDYKLGTVLETEIKESKDDVPYGIRLFSRRDYKRYVDYNLQDTNSLNKLDNKTGDLNFLFRLGLLSSTRLYKTWKKTISLKNLAGKFMIDQGMVLSNNRNFNTVKVGKFPGAFVLNAKLVDYVGEVLFGKMSNRVFEFVGDEDFESLYPRLILALLIESGNQLGRVIIPDPTFKEDSVHPIYGNLPDWKSYALADTLIDNNVFNIGKFCFNLPNRDKLIKKVMSI